MSRWVPDTYLPAKASSFFDLLLAKLSRQQSVCSLKRIRIHKREKEAGAQADLISCFIYSEECEASHFAAPILSMLCQMTSPLLSCSESFVCRHQSFNDGGHFSASFDRSRRCGNSDGHNYRYNALQHLASKTHISYEAHNMRHLHELFPAGAPQHDPKPPPKTICLKNRSPGNDVSVSSVEDTLSAGIGRFPSVDPADRPSASHTIKLKYEIELHNFMFCLVAQHR